MAVIDVSDQIKISAALPLKRLSAFTGSPLPVIVVGIPDSFAGGTLTGVAIAIVNADLQRTIWNCVRRNGLWRVLLPASCFPSYGFVAKGVKVSALVSLDGETPEITIGVGDLKIDPLSASSRPGDPVIGGTDVYKKSEIVDGVQHYKLESLVFNEEMGDWGLQWSGDYVYQDGEFVPVATNTEA